MDPTPQHQLAVGKERFLSHRPVVLDAFWPQPVSFTSAVVGST